MAEPKSPDAETSTRSQTTSSRSSWNCLTNGRPARAVTFQSMVRTSSPGTYSRTLSKSMPATAEDRVIVPGQRLVDQAARAELDPSNLLHDALDALAFRARRWDDLWQA